MSNELRTNVLERIVSELNRICENVPDDLGPQTQLREELGLNSLDAVDLALELEEAFDIELPDEALVSFVRVSDVVDAVVERAAAVDAD